MQAEGLRVPKLLTSITLARMAAIPAIMALVLVGDSWSKAYPAAAALFVAAALTDFVDGYLARRWAAATPLGSFLDTTADKLLVTGTLIALVAVDRASPWVVTIIVGREFVILALRGLVAAGGDVMAPSLWGKLKANVQFVAVTLAILRPRVEVGALLLDEWVMIVAAAVTVASAVEYLVRFGRTLSSRA
ncbi:MAG: CDP-diacylglycerol--glycerol-3-phosphate 3-phosphatidyltransferase [Actinomycetota bacterium]